MLHVAAGDQLSMKCSAKIQSAPGGNETAGSRVQKPGDAYWLIIVALAVLAITATTAAATATAATSAATTTATSASAATITTATTAAAAFPATAVAACARAATTRATIERGHVFGLRTLLSLPDFELDFLPFLELPEAPALNRGEVHEAILATIIRRDETVPLLSIEPLHYPCRAHRAQSPCRSVCS
jgi:hypothetical protein